MHMGLKIAYTQLNGEHADKAWVPYFQMKSYCWPAQFEFRNSPRFENELQIIKDILFYHKWNVKI